MPYDNTNCAKQRKDKAGNPQEKVLNNQEQSVKSAYFPDLYCWRFKSLKIYIVKANEKWFLCVQLLIFRSVGCMIQTDDPDLPG